MPNVTKLYLTALPNGITSDKKRLQLSVLLSPKDDEGDDPSSPFANWPRWIASNRWDSGWKVIFNGSKVVSPHVVRSVSDDFAGDRVKQQKFDESLWEFIFDGYSKSVKRKRDLQDLKNSWIISHRAHLIQNHLDTDRTIHSQLALPGNQNDANLLAQRKASRNVTRLYIHPRVGANGPGDENLNAELAAAAQAVAFFGNGKGPMFAGEDPKNSVQIARRVNLGLTRLGANSGRRLRGLALLALYLHCAESVGTVKTLANIATEIATPIYDPHIPNENTAKVIGTMQHFVEFHLYHRRTEDETQAMHKAAKAANTTPPPDDFQTMLARVNQFPAMLRSLGLIFDLEVDPPNGPLTTVSVSNGKVGLITPVGLTTNCIVAGLADATLADFYAMSHGPNQLLATSGTSRYVNLQAEAADKTKVFMFVTEDTDGSAQKVSQQTNAESRAAEYQSIGSADTSGPTTSSGRSVGVSLFYTQRGERTQYALSRTSQLASSPDNAMPALFAEDLILGYRVDVRRNDANDAQEKTRWRSLSARTGTYTVKNAKGDKLTYRPCKGIEALADEGFISPMASSPISSSTNSTANSTDTSAAPDPIVQVHQSLFTWTGWSLSVKPIFDSSKSSKAANSPSDVPKRIFPDYRLEEGSLPPLRFDQSYTFRCRVVDLAGNSVSPGDTDAPQFGLREYTPRRVEPIRPPHVLLTTPLPRKTLPGEQADLLVIRDGKGSSSRILAAPRETIRMAELYGLLRSDIPTDAYSNAVLMQNGSFPSVADALDMGLIQDAQGSPKVWNDAIFRVRKDMQRPNCPYLPDFLATWILLNPSLVREEGSAEVDPFKPIYIGLYRDPDPAFNEISQSDWPNCGPIRISLVSTDGEHPPTPSKRAVLTHDDDAHAPLVRGISIAVPKARSVMIQISSAAMNPSVKETPRNKSRTKLMELLQAANLPFENLLDGTHAPQTPVRQVTLVHAVRQPLSLPAFAEKFDIQRHFGVNDATVLDEVEADWWSTGKVTCRATWEDFIDDPKQNIDDPNEKKRGWVKNSEVAFELLAIGGNGKTTSRQAKGQLHHFRDTRAHSVTYALQAASSFRAYYPADEPESSFVVEGRPKPQSPKSNDSGPWGAIPIIVKSSVRPPVPLIAYIVPAFKWEDGYQSSTKTWAHGRIAALRIYLQRPFYVSGNRESIGFVLPQAGASSTVMDLCSRRGLDPLWRGGEVAGSLELSSQDFAGPIAVATGCALAETSAKVDVVPYEVHFAPERNMWFCDVRIDSKDAYYPFVRLGVVRYQPDSINDGTNDTRISPVVVADFMQIAPNRWLYLQKNGSKSFTLTISGVTYKGAEAAAEPAKNPACSGNPPTPVHSTFKITFQQRWHMIGKDLGWRPLSCDAIPNCAGPDSQGITTWRYDVHLPHSYSTHKYRLLIEEYEWFKTDSTLDLSGPDKAPQSRLVYADFFEL